MSLVTTLATVLMVSTIIKMIREYWTANKYTPSPFMYLLYRSSTAGSRNCKKANESFSLNRVISNDDVANSSTSSAILTALSFLCLLARWSEIPVLLLSLITDSPDRRFLGDRFRSVSKFCKLQNQGRQTFRRKQVSITLAGTFNPR
eukprot:Gregarina_sp_Poly_1__2847@NODE_1794_length_3317_cov_118_535692_g108_i1_p4_GENE_NODE_1794_length_3317_cov_118_535692_g108_i1NODE_1794_length_3317_cov_118_535692_g108_i1_p4_ORF_typecomplete_len147_score6_07BORA_N/PF15280_6/0_15_NODE_1794_length_3317_cov_118_535692_g108_i128653305